MNYIKKLEQDIAHLKGTVEGLREGIQDLRIYLDLPKFSNGRTQVECRDIYLRLEDAENLASERANEAVREWENENQKEKHDEKS